MTIQYDPNQTPEEISKKLYRELLDLPEDIRIGLQKLLSSTPIAKTSYLIEGKRNLNSRIMDVADDLLDSED
ncbi:Uncharacterised protein [uncultured archaeon]|nr:Uncharacterised protein [uncultured archaeon]